MFVNFDMYYFMQRLFQCFWHCELLSACQS